MTTIKSYIIFIHLEIYGYSIQPDKINWINHIANTSGFDLIIR